MASVYCEGEIGSVLRYRPTEMQIAEAVSDSPQMQEFDFIVASDSVNLFYSVGSLPSKGDVTFTEAPAAPRSRSLFYLSAGFGVFSAVVTGFALITENMAASSVSAFALCGALIAASAWLEQIKRER